MEVKFEYPPMWQEINDVFHVEGQPVIYAWDDIIYNPMKIVIPQELIDHEGVHSVRQEGKPEEWWKEYLVDPEFRLAEEIPAHQAEYVSFCNRNKDRNKRAQFLFTIAQRLSGPLYKNLISHPKAMKAIKQ